MSRLHLHVDDRIGDVSAMIDRADDPIAMLVLAHGAGAGMEHAFMTAIAQRLVARRVSVLRFQFPYTEAGKRRPDPAPRLHATIAAAIATARTHADGVALFAGGKSMGGRMTSQLAAGPDLDPDLGLRGLVFLGFPLHPPGKPAIERADHLDRVQLPMLFVQGTRDDLADFDLVQQVITRLGSRAKIAVVAEANHAFAVPKRTGRTAADVLDAIADVVVSFVAEHGASDP